MPTRSNRGNVTILVITVLAALALMGSVFIMIAWADRKNADAVAVAAPMRPVAEGQLMRVVQALANDLRMDGTGRYRDLGGMDPADRWKVAIDYASADPSYGDFDLHLAATERALVRGLEDRSNPGQFLLLAGRWPKITNLGDFPLAKMVNVDPNEALDADNPLVDTDGDGVKDARLFATGVFDPSGRQYYAAVRVVDTSAFVNVNTGYTMVTPSGGFAQMPPSMIAPGNLPLRRLRNDRTEVDGVQQFWLHSGNYLVHLRRLNNPAPAWGTDYSTFSDHLVARLENPNTSTYAFRPYDVADELACRWLDTIDNSQAGVGPGTPRFGAMTRGRLLEAAGDNAQQWAHYARYLTVYSVSRTLAGAARETDNHWRMPSPAKVGLNRSLADKADAFDHYRRAFYNMLPPGVPGLSNSEAARRKTAAQMALNLIDFRDGDDVPLSVDLSTMGAAFSGMSEKIAGIERQPFISHVWYRIVVEEAGDPPVMGINPDETRMAIVLYNPYKDAVNLSGWTVKVTGEADVVLPNGTTVNGESRLVLRSDADVQVAAGASQTVVSTLDPQKSVLLVRPGRKLDGSAGDDVAVAKVAPGDFGDSNPDTVAGSAAAPGPVTFMASIKRDLQESRFRLAVARYADPDAAAPDYTAAGSDIGRSDENNGVDVDGIAPTPVFVRGYGGGSDARIVNLGDLSRIFYVGPTPDEPLDQVLRDLTPDSISNGRLDSLALLDHSDSQWPNLPPYAYASEVFTALEPPTDAPYNDGTRVFGRININTAPVAVLATIPAMAERIPGPQITEEKNMVLAGDLVAYRDRLKPVPLPMGNPANWPATSVTRDYSANRNNAAAGASPQNLRQETGLAMVGELTPLLRGYGLDGLNNYAPAYKVAPNGSDDGYDGVVAAEPDLTKHDLRWAYLSNTLSVNSDTYCVYIRVQLDKDPDALTKRHYVALVDRSNCNVAGDLPIVRAFAEVK